MRRVLVIAPHPDDETLGCGGTLLRHKDQGDEIAWIIVTDMKLSLGYSRKKIKEREQEITDVASLYEFSHVYRMGFPTTRLNDGILPVLVEKFSKIFKEYRPQVIYLPFPGDAHSDHRMTFEAAAACAKWFRSPSVEKVLSYETLSETNFNLNPAYPAFAPQVFVDISIYLDKKIKILENDASECGEFPFPRSEKSIRSHAYARGSESGFMAAESFMLLRERLSCQKNGV